MLEETLTAFGRRWQQQARANLTKGGKNVSKELYNDTQFKVIQTEKGVELKLITSSYGDYVDKGVKGKSSSQKAPNSPYKFGSGRGKKGGLTDGIDKWVRVRRIQFQDKKSKKWLSYKSTAYIITRSVYLTGTKPSYFFSKPFENEFKKLPPELAQSILQENITMLRL